MSDWISILDSLPEDNELVAICYGGLFSEMEYTIGYLENGVWYNTAFYKERLHNVNAYLPLPKQTPNVILP